MDVTLCERCDGPVKVIASIEDPAVIKKILAHLEARGTAAQTAGSPPPVRAPPAEQFRQGRQG